MAEKRPVAGILFDWGETLVNVPGMIHSAERHLACVERMYCTGATECAAERYGVAWPAFREAYVAEVTRQIARSTESGREHSFEDRLAGTLAQLGIEKPPIRELSALVDSLGEHIVADVTLMDGVREVVPELARHYRLGIVSNYPCAPLVARSMERFGLLQYFSAIVVSGEWGFTKPHPDIYREALRRIDVTLERALFVGDDLVNDVKGPKAVGMRALWFAPHRQSADAAGADGHIVDLRELLPWCREQVDA